MTAERMRAAGRRWVAALTDGQRDRGCLPFDSERRRHWEYRPRPRPGLALSEMDAPARKRAHALLATAMSPHAFAQVTTIMGLEEVLDHLEGGRRDRRSDDFRLVSFGSPDAELWTWRFEGHHVSVTMSLVGDAVSPTPVFLGANPANLGFRGRPVIRPLTWEEDLARELLASLPASRRGEAVVSPTAPDDIRSRNAPDVSDFDELPGLRVAEMPRTARALLDELVDLYLHRLPPETARRERAALTPDRLRFAWEGTTEPGGGHYYRIQSPELLLEYDNTQNDANHVHTVLRRPGDDFGARLIPEHVATDHRKP
ncbi:uncharacterized protein DUF3500 [Stackebrandtia albiflava]|uniref:Uncharacterized protein DUF3500 n=1 Tax=Stackebrandtia albiflava TaxID=406432 RepID=A0A562V591_9ACTN|nr:DUF3500 domain-containing protein [Stackebrandtia albiflava]TWJ12977.1 uncharacterized protein DUF3500 [Stackebrandtia albiflava]